MISRPQDLKIGRSAMTSDSVETVPVVSLAMGDPAGISPELTARLMADASVREAARLVVIGDRRVLDQGARIAGVALDVETVAPNAPLPNGPGRPILVDLGHLDPSAIRMGEVQEAGGRYALENFKTALACGMARAAHAVCFTPFNKSAMRLAHPSYEDEIVFLQEMLGLKSWPASSTCCRRSGTRASPRMCRCQRSRHASIAP
jgi:4-hydroxythreonine-4-phosphate dehydrogenase